MSEPARLSFTVGRLLCGPVRRYLQRQAFYDASVKWLETRFLLESRFDVKADPSAIQTMGAALQTWAARLENTK